ncbi:hypothetical protein GCM10010274_48580 [Streptomyces lavendofoliae]|uniref:Uncharacterized protein n=1 Tax=Streptomyces lavendofoliae TaxID=67314 RepID=A0A918I2R0_9ACTN|nr:hypothetical protein GCM10010274_48580 [Streptomyces lavendofoliae]
MAGNKRGCPANGYTKARLRPARARSLDHVPHMYTQNARFRFEPYVNRVAAESLEE